MLHDVVGMTTLGEVRRSGTLKRVILLVSSSGGRALSTYCCLLKNNAFVSCSPVRLLTNIQQEVRSFCLAEQEKGQHTTLEQSSTRVEDIIDKPATHKEAKIIIADDHELTRDSIRDMLESVASEPHLQILREAKDGQEVIELCRLQRPDLVLMDVGMPKVNGLKATQTIKEEHSTTKVLIVSTFEEPSLVSETVRAGADGYLQKLSPLQEQLDAIRGVLRGESHYPSVSENSPS